MNGEFKKVNSKLFEGPRVFFNLLLAIQKIPTDGTIYSVVDALDECDSGLPELLNLIIDKFAPPSRVKWLITSRDREELGQELRLEDYCWKVSLEPPACLVL